MLYANGRYYDPTTGRFLTPDQKARNPYAPPQGPGLWLLLPLVGIVLLRKRGKGPGRMLVLVLVVGVGMSLVSCGGGPSTPTPTSGPTQPPAQPPVSPATPAASTSVSSPAATAAPTPTNTPANTPSSSPPTNTPPVPKPTCPPATTDPTATSTATGTSTPTTSLTEEQIKQLAQGLVEEASGVFRPSIEQQAYILVGSVINNHLENGETFEQAIAILDVFNPAKSTYKSPDSLPDPPDEVVDIVEDILDGTISDSTNGALYFVDRTYWQADALETHPELNTGVAKDETDALAQYMEKLLAEFPDIVSVEDTNINDLTYSLHAFKEWPPPKATLQDD